MTTTTETTGWTVLDFEGIPLAEGLPTRAAAVQAILTDDGYDYEIRRAEDGEGWDLWLTESSQNGAGSHRMQQSAISSLADNEDEAEAEIFEQVADMAWKWHAGGGYRIVTDLQRAIELAEDDEDDEPEHRYRLVWVHPYEATEVIASFLDGATEEELGRAEIAFWEKVNDMSDEGFEGDLRETYMAGEVSVQEVDAFGWPIR
jgi:hypothetical protein